MMKARGIIARVGVAIVLPILACLYIASRKPADQVMMGISATAFFLLLVWLAKDPKTLAKWMRLFAFLPLTLLGVILLVEGGGRYEPLHPFDLGAAAVLSSALLACAIRWRKANRFDPSQGERGLGGGAGNIVVAGLIGAYGGFLFIAPILVMLNGQSDRQPPFVAVGRIVDMKEEQSKKHGTSYDLILSGPAADYVPSVRKGELMATEEEYRAARIGDLRCVTVHTGMLGVEWVRFKPC
jgi:hypothetical protein